jgi:hypothetical protein
VSSPELLLFCLFFFFLPLFFSEEEEKEHGARTRDPSSPLLFLSPLSSLIFITRVAPHCVNTSSSSLLCPSSATSSPSQKRGGKGPPPGAGSGAEPQVSNAFHGEHVGRKTNPFRFNKIKTSARRQKRGETETERETTAC